jgi:hypothetical protein
LLKFDWVECDWSNDYDVERPTESDALKSIKVQAKLIKRFNNNKELGSFFKKILSLERNHLERNPQNTTKSAIKEISKKLSLSEIRIAEILQYCTIWYYYIENSRLN